MALSLEVLGRIRTILEEELSYLGVYNPDHIAEIFGAPLLARMLLYIDGESDPSSIEDTYNSCHPALYAAIKALEHVVTDDDNILIIHTLDWRENLGTESGDFG